MSNRSKFSEKNVEKKDIIKALNDKCTINLEPAFPFDGLLKGNPNELLTKILYINYRESTQIKNIDIEGLKNHLEKCLSESDYNALKKGELTDQYYLIIEKIAVGHGIHGKRKNKETNEDIVTKEYNLTSFASKFCGSHNQKAPFWDNLVSDLMNYLGFKCRYRDYRSYVSAFEALQKELKIEEYSLRQIESAVWEIADKAVNPDKYK